ncbi:hypothetical protein PLICRDRAFT_121747 [Plicaturopsis crispa FD-325 SS-3]|nr:hypothetical protein PLICRDRAFT_121747 [Plicaturopsis crispa FD-325 SS-3]
MPCGFCGLSNNPKCKVELTVSSKSVKVVSQCPYASKITYGWATKGTKDTPCRNVPIVCTLCPRHAPARSIVYDGVWRYNMAEHIRVQHSEYASPGNPIGRAIPLELWDDMKITHEEEIGVGIPPSFIPPPFTQVSRPASNNAGSNSEAAAGPSTRGSAPANGSAPQIGGHHSRKRGQDEDTSRGKEKRPRRARARKTT